MSRPVLAVLGGSFDPPHLGHTLIPTYLLARGLAERVLVAPCWSHPFAKQMRPFAERLALTRLAMAQQPATVEVSDIEAELAARRPPSAPSYSYDLLRAIAERRPGWAVRLVVGSDIIVRGELERWHRAADIMAEFSPIVVPRVGFAEATDCALPEISSTAVREWLAAGDDPAAQAALAKAVPAAVLRRLQAGLAGHVWLFGRGNVAAHAEPWLRERGWTASVASARGLVEGTDELPAGTPDAIWLLGQDRSLAAAAAALVARGAPRVPVLHAAGALVAREALAPAAAADYPVGTLHPICSLRRDQPHGRLRTCVFGVEGDAPARAVALRWIGPQAHLDLQGLDAEQRVRYHAACALAGNHLAVLSERSAETMRALGLPAATVERALAELLRSALENLLALGVPDGVSGPAARGDLAALERHAAALGGEAAEVYRLLSAQLVRLLAQRRRAGA
jgi:nicotinate (nicotinamide) nucleotide adenylyltransferase